jgi:hypothetical protein
MGAHVELPTYLGFFVTAGGDEHVHTMIATIP